jgi:hypothetical protein
MRKVWVCHTLSDIMPLYLSLLEGEGIIILQQKCYCIGESKEGAVSRLGTYYVQ